MNIQALPSSTLCDERFTIRISDLPPFAKVKIHASLIFPWATGVEYESQANFTADSSGNLDLSQQRPDSGSYDRLDSMGLVLSLKRVKGKFSQVMKDISVDHGLFIDISAECRQDRIPMPPARK